LFNLKIGGQDVALGPEQLINVFFSFMEDAIDRVRAQSRIEFVRKLRLNEIDFDRLDEYSISMLMSAQALSLEEMNKCRESIEKLRTTKYKDPSLRSFELGFLLLNRMGEDFVAKVFSGLPADCYVKAARPEQHDASLLDKLAQLRGHAPSGGVYYMAYGTSMCARSFRELLKWDDMEETEFAARCEPKKCKLNGYRLAFTKPSDPDAKDPALVVGLPNIELADKDSAVEGVLYKLTDDTLKFLDLSEVGYVRRHDVDVLVDDKPVKAEIYIAEGVRPGLRPDRDTLQKMLDGAHTFQLSKDYIGSIESLVSTAAPPPAPRAPAPAATTAGDPLAVVASELVAALGAPPSAESGSNGTHAQALAS
ncbi:MAG TPA: gamma-glutamylcyclotransferase family protein, partial [Pyrinomonadaceae bacterium]|nr:gamma-glutamylcyclotransferase family protein [Pyrinomonadaceae bacterium]